MRGLVLETERLKLSRLAPCDAPFILELLNEPSFLQFIGDRGVRTEENAIEYLEKGPIESYQRFGFGLYLVELREDGSPIGICGLIKRPELDDVDLGFALLPRFWSNPHYSWISCCGHQLLHGDGVLLSSASSTYIQYASSPSCRKPCLRGPMAPSRRIPMNNAG